MSTSLACVVEPTTAPVRVEVVKEAVDLQALVSWATTSRTGAVVTFVGTVRDHSAGLDGVVAIDYEVYEVGALARMRQLAQRCRASFEGIERIAVVHRFGLVALGEASVWVVVSAEHRVAAIDGATYCIDVLKETVPVWKREQTGNHGDHAVEGTPVDSLDEAHDRWFARHPGRASDA